METIISKLTKLNRIGLLLIILSVFTTVLVILASGLAGVAIWFFAQDFFLTPEMMLPENVKPTTTVVELIEMDREYMKGQYPLMTCYLTAFAVVQLLICWMLVRIGLSWKRNEAFSESVIQSLLIVGVISLLHGVYGLFSSFFIDSSFAGEIFFLSSMRDITVTGTEYGMIGSFTTGLLFIALSQVLKQGRVMKTEQELTV